jgi:hypothetical protein
MAHVVGCGHAELRLEPAPAATAAPKLPHTAVDESGGIELAARSEFVQPGTEPGMHAPGRTLARFRIWIHNRSQRTLQIRLQSFVLTAADGSQYAALPLFPARNIARQAVMVETPAFEHANFELAPYLVDAYPRLSQYCGNFTYDPLYYARYYDPDLALRLTTEELREVLPEGVLRPGGRLVGTLYFQSPSEADLRSGDVELRAALAPPYTRLAVAHLSLPFTEQTN